MDDQIIRIIPNFISVIQPFQEKGFGRPDLLTLQIHQSPLSTKRERFYFLAIGDGAGDAVKLFMWVMLGQIFILEFVFGFW